MQTRLFGLFSALIDRTPTPAVLPIVEAEHRMMEDDFVWKRVSRFEDEEVDSVWSFCDFLLRTAYGYGAEVASAILPLEHFAFYRNTVERLIEAGELPTGAKEQFDHAFSTSIRPELASAA